MKIIRVVCYRNVQSSFTSSDSDVGHFRITVATFASLFSDRSLRILKELERGLGRPLIFHLINCLLYEAEQIVDVLRIDERAFLVLVEVQIGVQDLYEQIEILWLRHANLRRLQRLAKLSHHLVALLAASAEP